MVPDSLSTLDYKSAMIMASIKSIRFANGSSESSVGNKQSQFKSAISGDEILNSVPQMGPDGFFTLALNLALF